MALTLFQVLSFDQRVIVLSSVDTGEIYTWNLSLTLQAWHANEDGTWAEVDIRTLSRAPRSFSEARVAAEKWLYDIEAPI